MNEERDIQRQQARLQLQRNRALAAPPSAAPGVAEYERLLREYKGAVILYYEQHTEDHAADLQRCRTALDAYVEGLRAENERLRDALSDLAYAAQQVVDACAGEEPS
jgi:signal transduction protein with GAF and PtsI domain